MVSCCLASSGCRIIPEKAVTQGGIENRKRGFCIIVDNLTGCTLAVKQIDLLLSHTIEMFPLVGVEDDLDAVMIALHMLGAVIIIAL